MRYIKQYEDFAYFKKGDFVKFNFDEGVSGGYSPISDIFEIIEVDYLDDRKYNTIKCLRTDFVKRWTLDSSLRHLTEDEEIELQAIKYNL
jgi:hypothetical protein